MAKAAKARTRKRPIRAAPAQAKPVGVPYRPTTPAKTYTSKPVAIEFAGPAHRYARVDLEILGLDHSGSSYEGRVFLNSPSASASTPRTLDQGYAGSFYVFGHGGCFGDPGHCVVAGHRDVYDFRDPQPIIPTFARVNVTAALRPIARTKSEVTVTIVPVVSAATDLSDPTDVFKFEKMRFLTYDG
jgi:tyrosinase